MSEEMEESVPTTQDTTAGDDNAETETTLVEENPDKTTPTDNSESKPRPRYFPYRRGPHFRRGCPGGPLHHAPFRMGYHMYPPKRIWSPRPYMMPPHTTPYMPYSDPPISPTDASFPQEQVPSTQHWLKHLENAIFRPCFDWLEATEAFPRVNPEIDDSALNEALTLRGEELLPSETEIKVVVELVDMILAASKRIASSDEEADKEIKLDEAILVGSFKKQTYTKGATTADIVILLKELPTEARLDKLNERLIEQTRAVAIEELEKHKQELEAKIEQLKSDQKEVDENELSVCMQKLNNYPSEPEYSCTTNKLTSSSLLVISSKGASAKIFVTTESSLIKQEDNTEDRVDLSTFEFSLRMVRHAKWFESTCMSDTIPCLVRVLKDMKKRFPGWKAFNPWLMDLVAQKAVLDKCNEPREIGAAFRYVLQFISAGCFLLGYYGVEDPCEKQCPAAQYSLGDEAKDEITLAGQILLRMLQNGAYREIIGGQGIQVLDLSRPFSVGGIQFAPPQRAFEPTPTSEDITPTIQTLA
ncbi:Interleukin enhancer-binding factor 2 [Oopsacas minuta]|uniref:Interleukin enhancer-binding factor 2 n=1 Tax=Oopsacas minuta TaxID=111878 RepID=A0AAV7K916_9METZ|nr:Interleukin enhancer-binding factor 2 [Oopsacas minuta]